MKRKRGKRWSWKSAPWWVGGGLALFVFGSFGALLALVPDYSPGALRVGVALMVAGVVVGSWGTQTKSWWSQMASVNLLMLSFLSLGIRFLAAVVPGTWVWLPLVLMGYLLALALPLVHPRLSEKLAREQIAPQTRFGRGCLAFSAAMLPAAGLSGYWLYEFSKRAGRQELAYVLGGVLGFVVAIGGTQYFTHHLWPKRPWAQKAEAEVQAEA